MDYELAKQLVEASFPIKRSIGIAFPCSVFVIDEKAYFATDLSKLIEACEKSTADFEAPTKEHSHAGDSWVASSFHSVGGKPIQYGQGSTPEEVVARLWLALHANGDATA